MIDLTKTPFCLSQDDIDWVKSTLDRMTVKEKIGQLFCVMGMTTEKEHLRQLVHDMHIGGIMFRPMPGSAAQDAHRFLQNESKIPLLTAANLESGGNGIATEGTDFAKPLQVGATNANEQGYRLGKIACREGSAAGCNWAFAPIVDIDMNFRNPITNLRTFGDNKELVLRMAKGYLLAADEENMAVSIKHFPGDGVDERDQHLITSVNSLSTKEWDETFGEIYSELINQGAKTVMVGHISQPAYSRKLRPAITDEEIMPASLSEEILNDLLRKQLGFHGLIVTDASLMIGFTVAMKRELAVPTAIANGCDMFLFTKDLAEDYQFMLQGYHKGIITEERLNDAVTRILATKASLNLHNKQTEGTLVPMAEALSVCSNPQHQAWAKEVADQSVTLVKDTQQLLPLSPEKYKRIYLIVLEDALTKTSPTVARYQKALEQEGFDVTVRNRDVTLDVAKLMTGAPPTPEEMELLAELGGIEKNSTVAMVAIPFMILVYVLTPILTKRMDRMSLYKYSIIGSIVMGVVLFFVGYQNFTLFLVITVIKTFVEGFNGVLMFTFSGDAVEYGHYKTGIRKEGITFSLQTFSAKFTAAIAGVITSLVLVILNYKGGEVLTATMRTGIWAANCFLPSLGALISLPLLMKYDLKVKDVQIMANVNSGHLPREEGDAMLSRKY